MKLVLLTLSSNSEVLWDLQQPLYQAKNEQKYQHFKHYNILNQWQVLY